MEFPATLPLIGLDGIVLKAGGHARREDAVCAMEAVAWLAGEPHSDKPACACPVIGAFMIAWNDALPDDDTRARLLKPLLPLIIGTRASAAVEERRSWMALDWMARVHAPAWCDLSPALRAHAATLRALAPLVDADSARQAQPSLDAARAAVGDAARAAVGDAAWAAAGDAAWAAARAAAGDAAWAAAGDAAWAALQPTVEQLQASAADLVRRMCAVT